VLIVSGETSPDELAKVHAAGAQMLHKPVRPAVLFKHLNAALHRRTHPPESHAGGGAAPSQPPPA
jgi:DNA-binding response OmpR family regulator